jgi:hypothetical protein
MYDRRLMYVQAGAAGIAIVQQQCLATGKAKKG